MAASNNKGCESQSIEGDDTESESCTPDISTTQSLAQKIHDLIIKHTVDGNQSNKTKEWHCDQCTFINKPESSICFICGAIKLVCHFFYV